MNHDTLFEEKCKWEVRVISKFKALAINSSSCVKGFLKETSTLKNKILSKNLNFKESGIKLSLGFLEENFIIFQDLCPTCVSHTFN